MAEVAEVVPVPIPVVCRSLDVDLLVVGARTGAATRPCLG